MSDKSEFVGAFSLYTCDINQDAREAFQEAMEGLTGVGYQPVAVSQQVVAGMNYKFFCNSRQATRYPISGAAIVSIYKPLDGKAHVTNIQNIQ